MAMATRSELIAMVLVELGVIPAGTSPATADSNTVGGAYDAVWQELSRKGWVNWGSASDIPTWAELDVRDIVKNRVTSGYGLPRNVDEETLAMRALARYLTVDYYPTSDPKPF